MNCQPQRMSITRVSHHVNIEGPSGGTEFGPGGKINGKLADSRGKSPEMGGIGAVFSGRELREIPQKFSVPGSRSPKRQRPLNRR